MQYRAISGTDIKVSKIGLGTWAVGGPYWTNGEPTGWTGPLDRADIERALHYAIDNGVNHVDTADVYGHGKSERLLGEILASRRKEIIVATKVGFTPTSAEHAYDATNIRRQLEQSLRNLQTDYIDIYYFHHCDFGDDDRYLHEAASVFEQLKQEGKIRAVGLSGYSSEELIRCATVVRPSVIQSWADIEHDEFIRPGLTLPKFMAENHIDYVAMMPLGQGRLLGKYDPQHPPTFGEGDNRLGNQNFSVESLTELGPRLAALKERFGANKRDLIWAALGFVLAREIVKSAIPGFRNLEQVKQILETKDRPFAGEDLEFIYQVFPREEMGEHPWN